MKGLNYGKIRALKLFKRNIKMTPEDFYKALQEEGFNLSQQQKDQFQRYFELLVEWNEKINLTAITDKNDVYLKHFYDSLAPVLQGHIKNQNIRLLDIGAGAGFPSLPMKILCPKLEVTIIDSLNKRINFLNLLADELQLSGVHFYHGRAEDFGQDKDFRAQFDVVTARAVARLQILSELTIPFLKVGGQLIALKAAAADEELAEAKNALNLLFAKPILNDNYHLPNGDGRHITIVEKKKETPNKYPRRAGMPNKKPL
jgi:16S rRNA (guanine527-N7)-methyltransferase